MYPLVMSLVMILASSTLQAQVPTFRRGDIVRLRGVAKPAQLKVAAVGGDRIRADETGIYVNEVAVTGFSHEFLTDWKRTPTEVPRGHYLVLGEQRLNDDVSGNMSIVPESSLEKVP
jgi:Signal peptidase, peptidase S26